jgi:hypothetical protein
MTEIAREGLGKMEITRSLSAIRMVNLALGRGLDTRFRRRRLHNNVPDSSAADETHCYVPILLLQFLQGSML